MTLHEEHQLTQALGRSYYLMGQPVWLSSVRGANFSITYNNLSDRWDALASIYGKKIAWSDAFTAVNALESLRGSIEYLMGPRPRWYQFRRKEEHRKLLGMVERITQVEGHL